MVILKDKVNKKVALICYFFIWLFPIILNFVLDVKHIGMDNKELFYNPNFITFVVGNGVTRVFQYLVTWLFPLWIYYIFLKKNCDILREERKYLYSTRDKKYFQKKTIKALLITFITLLIVALCSYSLSLVLFAGGNDTLLGIDYIEALSNLNDKFLEIQYLNPMATNLVFIFVYAITGSMLALYITLIANRVSEERNLILYIIVPWLIAVLTKYSAVDLFQAFTENSLIYYVLSFFKINLIYLLIILYLSFKKERLC